LKINTIRSDHGGEFENAQFDDLCSKRGYRHEYSAPRTPKQNGVVEKKNRTLQELARTMLNESKLPTSLWAEAVNTTCYVINRVNLRPILLKTPYELWMGRKPNISYFRAFGSKCFIIDEMSKITKFDSKSIEGVFVGYSITSKAYKIYLPTSNTIKESMHVKFDENANAPAENGNVNDVGQRDSQEDMLDDGHERRQNVIEIQDPPQDAPNQPTTNKAPLIGGVNQEGSSNAQSTSYQPPKNLREVSSHPLSNVIGNPREGVRTKSGVNLMIAHCAFVSQIEPTKFEQANMDPNWIIAMQLELNQFKRNKVWELVPRPKNRCIIGTKWVFRNKKNQEGNVVRNKAILVAQGFRQSEGLDYDETSVPVARLESNRMLLAYASCK
jgi:Reverse transcriptase (RNA-dependent DNA polymerase)